MEKENEGKDGAEPRRQSATGNLKSCANTRAVGGLDERCGAIWRKGGYLVGWWVVGRKYIRKKATQDEIT